MFLYFILLSSVHFCNSDDTTSNKQGGDFDEFILVQSQPTVTFYTMQGAWPTTAINCEYTLTSEAACLAVKRHDRWIARRLRPHKYHGLSPSGCQLFSFYITALEDSLVRRLHVDWPSLVRDKPSYNLWSSVWDEDGSCSRNLPHVETISKYFRTALDLLDEHNVGRILRTHKIKPGSVPSLNNIYSILKESIGKAIGVRCFIDQANKEQYIHEIEICFHKTTMEIIDCYHPGFHECDSNNEYAKYASTVRV